MIIGLTGTLASGKGVISEFLKERGFVYFSLSDELRELAMERGIELTRENLQNLGNLMREERGVGFLAQLVCEKIKIKSIDKVVVDGIRNPGEILQLKKMPDFVLISVDASPEIRFKRIQERNREKDPKTWEDFLKVDARDKGVGENSSGQAVSECMNSAHYSIINEGNLDNVNREVERVYNQILNRGVKNKMKKREDYLTWDEYFMGIALLSSGRSKDPNTRVGACIVNNDKKIVGIGYNGFPTGCSDDILPWAREGEFIETKYPYVCHAELNAILNSMGRDLRGCSIYVALFPCNECAKAIIQSGIKEVIYLSDKYSGSDSVKVSKIMFNQAGIKSRQFIPDKKNINISFEDN
jgi:dCMP deaminase